MADYARLPSRNMADIEASPNTKDACMRSVQGKDSARFEVRMNPHPADRERPRRHGEQTSLLEGPWIEVRDGDPTGMSIFKRHYTARKTEPKIFQFVGPGEKMVLLTPDAKALFVWRKFISDAGEVGVNCAVFRNEGSLHGQSSDLILAAKAIAWERWPGERLYTYVDASKIRPKRDPGKCFLEAGFTRCDYKTRDGKLVFEAFA